MNATDRSLVQPPRLTWAQARLRLGISNVGFWVVVALLVVAVRPAVPEGVAGWGALVVGYGLIQAPFDWAGGRWLPSRYSRPVASLVSLVRGIAAHGAVLFALGAALLTASALAPWVAAAVWSGALLALIAGQAAVAAFIAPLVRVPATRDAAARLTAAGLDPATVRVVDAHDRSFVGGWTGLPGAERLIVSRRWLTELDTDTAEVGLVRLAIARRSGERWRGVLAAVGWTVGGMALVLLGLPGAGVDSPSALLVTSAGGTLWSFVGLLTLPRFSRGAVFALDRRAADQVGEDRVRGAVARLDEDQEDEPQRPESVEQIFHPVPSPANRVHALAEAGPITGTSPWRVARIALYSSWTQLSWIARAVHCNAGRPELWVLYPGD